MPLRAGFADWTVETVTDGSATLSVLEEDGVPVGRMRVVRHADHIELAGLQLAPRVQGRGLGTARVRLLQGEAAARGVPLRLGVEHDNPRARALYERLGFAWDHDDTREAHLVWRSAYELDDAAARVDLDAVWDVLSTQVYWARWRSRADVEAQVRGAWRVVAAYDASGALVGFARSISDGVALAYLADVFVLPEHRGHALGHALVHRMIDLGPGADFRWMLHTADAHGLYRSHGFGDPGDWYLERPSRGVQARQITSAEPV